MNRKVSLGVAVAGCVLAVALTVSATMMLAMRHFSALVSNVGQRQAMYDYLDEIDSAARGKYTIDEELLRTALAKGYLEGLNDPYAAYLSAEDYKVVQNALAGNYTGFGFRVTVVDNKLTVSYVADTSPAALAGIKKGDIVTVVDEEAMTGASYTTISDKLVNSEKMLLTVSHDGKESAMELTVNTYTDPGVEGYIVQDTVGYIRIRFFNNLTAMQFKNVYNELTRQGAQYFVFDLRNNTGGSLAAVKEILGYLLPSGPYATCVKKDSTETYTASDPYEMTARSATLVNGNTEGEAELFAGVMQDLSKAVMVGSTTAGKAVVQEYFSLASDKAAVRLTVGEITLMKSGSNWADKGLIPDRLKDLSYDKMQRFDLLSYGEDDQLKAAVELRKSNENVTTPDSNTTTATTTTPDSDGVTTAGTAETTTAASDGTATTTAA